LKKATHLWRALKKGCFDDFRVSLSLYIKGIKKTDSILEKDGENGIVTIYI